MEKQALKEAASEAPPGALMGEVGEKPAGEIKASPAAKRLAKERGIDLSTVKGTGPDGRIVREDVLAAAAGAAGAPESAFEGRPGESVPMGKMRRSIAENMGRSAHSVARVVHFAEVDMTRAVEYREAQKQSFKDAEGADLSYNVIIVKAAALAMREYPALNVSLDGGAIRKHADINIGLAVALDDGLITVSIKDADKKSLPEIARDSASLIEKAKAGSYTLDEITGGSITVSSLGAYDIDCFTPIINLPEAAIIGVGSITKKPVVKDDKIEIAPIMKLSLSFDHRLVDGAPAARYLQILKTRLEEMDILNLSGN
jgi:pyruvate dehydrogenase E2 component (dihydrolipoamide acetyltransferase)